MVLILQGVELIPMTTATTTGKAVSPDRVLTTGRTGMRKERMITFRAQRQEMRDLLLPQSTRTTFRRRGVKDHLGMVSLHLSQGFSLQATRSGARNEREIITLCHILTFD